MTVNDDGRIRSSDKALIPLRPKYVESEHELYLRRLQEALDSESNDRPLNIALTGSYGSGKSSVLTELARLRPDSVVNVSLPTFFSPDASSNEIQKEVVKQLLYREKPSQLTGSRFRRIDKLRPARMIAFSAVSSAFLLLGIYLSGASKRLEDLLTDRPIALTALWVGGYVGLALLIIGAQAVLHNRLRISGFTAGPTTVVTDKVDESYFDQYLDEIVYFFSATKCSIAVFEDLDRFERVEIFDELRELNVLLNSSKQVGKPIRFVFALRDSIFQEIGEAGTKHDLANLEDAENAPSQLERSLPISTRAASARAKFFDLVIPVVPFATNRTALDLWVEIMAPEETGVSVAALAIAAAHVRDMRVIKMIRNEYDVFSENVIKNGLTELRANSLFGLMVYKSVHLDDFELIKTSSSRLDKVETLRRGAISAAVQELDAEIIKIESGDRRARDIEDAARSLGARLEEMMSLSYRIGRRPAGAVSMVVDASAFDSNELRTPAFWIALKESGGIAEVTANGLTSSLTLADFQTLLGENPNDRTWTTQDSLDTSAAELRAEREALLHAELADLVNFANKNFRQRFALLKNSLSLTLQSPLAEELFDARLLDQNFSLYVGRFYGRVVSRQALNFVLHVVQPGIMDIDSELEGIRDTEAVIAEAGSQFLQSKSALNIDLVDALADDSRLEPVLTSMMSGSVDAAAFMNGYVSRGMQRERLFKRLAPTWAGVLQFISEVASFDEELALSILDSSLRNLSSRTRYVVTDSTSSLIRKSLPSLPLVREALPADALIALQEVLSRSQMEIEDISLLDESLKSAVVKSALFEINSLNMASAFGEPSRWTLDELAAADSPIVIRKMLGRWEQYVDVVPPRTALVTRTNYLSSILSTGHEIGGSALVGSILRRAASTLVLDDLRQTPPESWPTIVQAGRASESARNWHSYVAEHDVDEALESRLRKKWVALEPDELSDVEKITLATAVLGRESLAPSKRSRYIRSLGLTSPLAAESLPRQQGDMVGYLVRDGIIEDSAETFDALTWASWTTRLEYIKRSKNFATYASLVTYKRGELVSYFQNTSITKEQKLALLRGLPELAAQITPAIATAAAWWISSALPQLRIGWLDALATAGADGRSIVRVIVTYKFSDERFIEILSRVQNPWRALASKGRSKPSIPGGEDSEKLLLRLRDIGTVSSWKSHKGNQLQVNLRQI